VPELHSSVSHAAVARAAAAGAVLITRKVQADLVTPLGVYRNIAGHARDSFLFESIEGGERLARYCFMGADPWKIVRGRATGCLIQRNGQVSDDPRSALELLREHFRGIHLEAPATPLAGGVVGYLGYEFVRHFEPAARVYPGEPDSMLMFFRTVVVFDRVQQTVIINSILPPHRAECDSAPLRRLHDEAVAAVDRIAAVVTQPPAKLPAPDLGASASVPASNFTRSSFEAAVRQIKEHILAGDCYQTVLSQCFRRPTCADPVAIYRALRLLNPSPYMFLLRSGGESLIGSSPEMLVRCRERELEYRPIAGTCPRGANEQEDATLAARLLADEKERAEHVMLVDLGRNDLGRVCEFGSIRVEQLMGVERYSHVQHLVSQIRGRMRPSLDAFDALSACFPAGTVTGAPKVKAMEIINRLEPSPRGPYAGSVFYRDYAGNLDACIAIRMLHLRNGEAAVQAGAGIVADSDPAREYDETVSKARGMWAALAAAEAAP